MQKNSRKKIRRPTLHGGVGAGPKARLLTTRTLGPSPYRENHDFLYSMSRLQRSPRGLPGALYKTSKSIPRYSKTSLFCQERAKIFQDEPPRISFFDRNPRSLQERTPRRARAGLEGWAAVPRRMASSIETSIQTCLFIEMCGHD